MMATTTPNAISDVDRDALERALAIMLRHRELGGDKRRIAEGQSRGTLSPTTLRSAVRLQVWA